MCAEPNAQENSSTAVIPGGSGEIVPAAPWRVAEVEPLEGFRLRVVFVDGRTGEVDMARLVHSPDAGVFRALADPSRFAQVSLEYGAVTWPGDVDLAPDAMYEAIRTNQTWTI